MQSILAMDPVMFIIIVLFAILVGTVSSMLGIGGGTFNTPLLVILFALSANQAAAASLFAAMFVSISGTVSYTRMRPVPIVRDVGIMVAFATIPGSIIGAWSKTLFDNMTLRLIFAVLISPLAIKMIFAKRRPGVRTDFASEVASLSLTGVSNRRRVYALIGSFVAGVLAGLLGLGGGVIIVPVLTMIVGLPMHAAVATSMFAMIFTAIAGTATNALLGQIDLGYAIGLGIGMLIGAQIGPSLACHVEGVRLKQIFGVLLILPLIRMAGAGEVLFGPDPLYNTTGDIIIWLSIVLPLALFKRYQSLREMRSQNSTTVIDSGQPSCVVSAS